VNGLAGWAARTRVAGEYATSDIQKLSKPAAMHPESRKSHFHFLAEIFATFLVKRKFNITVSPPRLAAVRVQANHGLIQTPFQHGRVRSRCGRRLMQCSAVIAAVVYDAATRKEMLPRKPLPKAEEASPAATK
jgi:hypothetical protein